MWIDLQQLDPSAAYKLLTSTITPRPIAWVSSVSADGVLNLAPFSFFQMITDQPPTLMISTQHKADGSRKDTSLNIEATRDFVVNLVPHALANEMNISAAAVPADESEFDLARLEQAASSQIKVPRVALAPVALECRLAKLQPYPPENPSCEVIFAEVLAIYINPTLLDANGMPDPYKMDLISRIGGSGYSRVAADIFQLARPASAVRR
jgi:flavin reductase (DIM6/NTAB) family NADH-FMN oxidoreductase RutF